MESSTNFFLPFDSIPLKKIQNSKKFLFLFLFILEIITNIDTGIFICSFKNGFNMSEFAFSMIGCFSSLGRAFFGIFFTPIFNRKDVLKNYYISGILVKSFSFFFYYFIDSEIIFYSLRFLSGGIQMFNIIFFPSWVSDNLKSYFLIYISQIAKLIGISYGYYITINEKNEKNYKNNFFSYGIILLFSSFILIIIPSKLFNCNKTIYIKKKKQNEKYESNDFDSNVLNTNILLKIRNSKNDSDDEEDLLYNYALEESGNKTIESIKKKRKYYIIKMIFKPIFLFSILTRCLYANIFSVMLFWFNDFINFFKINPNLYSCLLFFVIIVVSPIIGLVLNNFLMNLMYKNSEQNKLVSIILFSIVSYIIALFYNLIQSFYYFIILGWIYIICLTFPLNSMIEFDIGATYHIFKREGFIISNIIINVFGNCFGIYYYGYKKKSVIKFNYLIFSTFLYLIFCLLSLYSKWNGTKRIIKQKKSTELSQGTNYLRFSRTSDLKEDINKINQVPLSQGRISIDDNDENIDDEQNKEDQYHILNIKNFLKK
jgi:hypothetical protein